MTTRRETGAAAKPRRREDARRFRFAATATATATATRRATISFMHIILSYVGLVSPRVNARARLVDRV